MNYSNIDSFHDLILPIETNKEIVKQYTGFVNEELAELQDAETLAQWLKEACDVIVVNRPIARFGNELEKATANAMIDAMVTSIYSFHIEPEHCLRLVNDSNLSKLILVDEIETANTHFKALGISVYFDLIGKNYFGAYSLKDQTVDGKFYKGGKLLKGPSYYEINTNIKWWL